MRQRAVLARLDTTNSIVDDKIVIEFFFAEIQLFVGLLVLFGRVRELCPLGLLSPTVCINSLSVAPVLS